MATEYDVVIVGAGPTGLAAAVYTGREELSTLVLDKGVAGGLIATTETVDNYPGFSDGIGGIELSDQLRRQAERFGAEVKLFTEVKSLQRGKDRLELETGNGTIKAKSVLLATGSNYRHLDVPGEAGLIGRGVHYCATCDGPLYRGKTVIAVGGGNSALQEGLFLAKFVDKLILLVRGKEFRGSELLVDALKSKPNVEVRFEAQIAEVLSREDKLSGVKLGGGEEIQAEGLFPFIGLLPNSDWLNGVQLDQRGFVKVDREFKTNIEGVFAAGDIVEGSVGQVASAVGEGVTAALSIRKYLDPHHQEAPSYAASGS
jgi:thioredoxin reductase (NADPH)